MSKYADYEKLYKTEYNKLAAEHAVLKNQHSDLTKKYEDLKREHELQEKYLKTTEKLYYAERDKSSSVKKTH